MTNNQNNNQYKRKLANIEEEHIANEEVYQDEDLWCSEEVDQLVFNQTKKRKVSNESLDEIEENSHDNYSDTSSDSSVEDFGEVGELLMIGNRPEDCFYLSEFTGEPKVSFLETKLSITKIPADCWAIIYTFSGLEHYFINRIYKLNTTLRESLYESELFWEGVIAEGWPDAKNFTINWREYFFKKFIAFETHKRLNPQIITGDHQATLVSFPIQRTFENECFIYNQIETTTCVNQTVTQSNMNWIVNVFLKTCPKIVGLRIQVKFPNLRLWATFNNKEFPIFDEDQVVLNGVQNLFHAMNLNVDIHAPFFLDFDERFQKLRIGELEQSTYFAWFCNRILGDVPFPIEEILGLHDYTNHLSFGLEEERNRIIELYYKYKKLLGL
ncbi:predicted protein [Naegleria gruberi]|uniref:Predicted protein n=1 Tax=Naegleria gruberi TaxID=5762 RepID=D2W261_NAEGR|nr:uncharacterized protein NAEGRDRAFT_54118 [Naegleria gruberi]EFC36765.1 predicted protein [Naegleria gruberi]|eukprot:XP_002669509.1 predicted protein [Naegleria gruberi strain NEG-M]